MCIVFNQERGGFNQKRGGGTGKGAQVTSSSPFDDEVKGDGDEEEDNNVHDNGNIRAYEAHTPCARGMTDVD